MTETAQAPWFVLQLRPQGLTRAIPHLARQGFDTFSPQMKARKVRRGIARDTSVPLFPGYLFVSFDPGAPGWGKINSTRGVARLVLNDPRRPVPLPQEFIAGLMAHCDAGGLLLPPEELQIGDEIRILAGPFADFVTRIETLPDESRVGLLIELMGRPVRTTVSRDMVDKID